MRKLIIGFAGAYLLALIGLVLMLYNASPGPIGQDILGVGIGSYNDDRGIVYLSGRRLHCSPLDDDTLFTSRCTVAIAGKQLEVLARRNPLWDLMQLGGSCAAYFDGRQWPCRIGSRHVHTHWFAYINDPLGLDKTQLDALRSQYFFENLPEQPFLSGIFSISTLTACVAMFMAVICLRQRAKSIATFIGTTITSGAVAFVSMFIFAVMVTSGFWD